MSRSKKNQSFKKKHFITIISFIAAIIYLLFFAPLPDRAEKIQLDGTLQVHMIDVGQGDSILVVSPEGDTMLIDTGTNDSEAALQNYLDTQGITNIKYAVFTHPHEDHIGGADMVMNNYTVENAILPDVSHTSSTYERMVEGIYENNVNAIFPSSGDEFELGSAKIKILGPVSSGYEELNDYSIVLRVDYGGTSFMFTGDAEVISEKEILDRYPISELKCDVLKMGHHGSSTSSCDEFLDAVSPSMALISCGENNDYGHPHREIVAALKERNIPSFRTDELGSVVLKADGMAVTIVE